MEISSPSLEALEESPSSSRLPGFYELPIGERRHLVARVARLGPEEEAQLGLFGSLTPELADVFIENAVGTYPLPLGVATNFRINGRDLLVPMAVEESSVLAAASHGAKLARSGGGFETSSTAPIMTGQIQFFPRDMDQAIAAIKEHKQHWLDLANQSQSRLVARGGGAKDLSWRVITEMKSLVIYLDIDTRDAMGANIVNTMAEQLSSLVASEIECRMGLRILTNLTDKRLARAQCLVKKAAFDSKEFSGSQVVRGIVDAYLFAKYDPYRAATHNKGVMNGIDPVVIATGNDWRAVEAGAHAYCTRQGGYAPMTRWEETAEGDLAGFIELPMAVGTVGGVTKLHPLAQAALKILGFPSACALAEIICAVGLAQNLSALRALASEGIQKGHMSLHQKNLEMMKSETTH